MKTKLRVWNAVNVGSGEMHYFDVDDVVEAVSVIDALAQYQLTLPEHVVSSNAFGLEEYDSDEDEWLEWYDADGNDLDDYRMFLN